MDLISSDIAHLDFAAFMREALAVAEKAGVAGELPVGAVVVIDGEPLCLGAAVMADIPHIIFALPDGQMHSSQTVECNPYVRRHIKTYHGGVLAEEAAAILARYDPQALEYIRTGGAQAKAIHHGGRRG